MQPNSGQNQKPNMQGVTTTAAAVPQPFKTEIVSNIPVKAPAGGLAKASSPDEDDELDKIMADVSRNVDQIGKKGPKKHFAMFKHQSRPAKSAAVDKTHTQPANQAQPAAAQPHPEPEPAAKAESSPVKDKAALASKPANQNSAPLLAVTVTILVTGVLIAAAYYAYK